jgi:hypothetical protein
MPKKFAKGSATDRGSSGIRASDKLSRLRNAMKAGERDTPSVGLPDPSKRLKRDASGRIPPKLPSVIRDAILTELESRGITRYQLWKLAKEHCGTIPESAIYEFLRGQRHLGLEYIEALIAALHLAVVPIARPTSKSVLVSGAVGSGKTGLFKYFYDRLALITKPRESSTAFAIQIENGLELLRRVFGKEQPISSRLLEDEIYASQWTNRIVTSAIAWTRLRDVVVHQQLPENRAFVQLVIDGSGYAPDTTLQELWANLLVSCVKDRHARHQAFLETLKALGPDDAQLFRRILSGDKHYARGTSIADDQAAVRLESQHLLEAKEPARKVLQVTEYGMQFARALSPLVDKGKEPEKG